MLKDHAARAVGCAGSGLIAVGGLGAGALPVGIPFFAGGSHARPGLVCVYSGLALLLLGWWWYGRVARQTGIDDPWRTLALWVAPLLLAPPMFSREVYSYLAQGLVWLLPGIFLLLDHALSNPDPVRRKRRLAGLALGVVVLSSSVVWLWWADPHGWAPFAGSNAYVWLTFLLLAALMTRNCHTHPARCAHCQRREQSHEQLTGHRDQRSGENIR